MKKNYEALAKEILQNVGGNDNIVNVMHCYTRLRLNLKDIGLADVKKIEALDVIGVQFVGEQLQIIIGNEVPALYKALLKISGLQEEKAIDEVLDEKKSKKKHTLKTIVSSVIDGIVGCMIPILPMLVASGVLKAIVLILTQFHIVAADSPTMFTLGFVADSAFYFLPVIIAVFAAKKFGATIALAAVIGAAMIHPDFIARVADGAGLSVFGLPIFATNYTSSVIPIILSVWVMSYVEKWIARYSPKALYSIIVPVVTILIMIPLTFVVLAPLGAIMSNGFADALTWFYATFGILAVVVFCAIIPWVVMLGMHVGTVPISIAAIAETGVDKMIMPAFLISNFTQGAACIAVGIKTKEKDLKSLSLSSAFSMIVPGISEPGMYGVTLRYRTPLWGAMIGAASGGLYFGITGVGAFSFLPPNIFGLAAYAGEGAASANLMNTVIGILIGMVVAFFVTLVIYKPEK